MERLFIEAFKDSFEDEYSESNIRCVVCTLNCVLWYTTSGTKKPKMRMMMSD